MTMRECLKNSNDIGLNRLSIDLYWQKVDGHRSQIGSPLIDIDEESIVHRLKSIEGKPRQRHSNHDHVMMTSWKPCFMD